MRAVQVFFVGRIGIVPYVNVSKTGTKLKRLMYLKGHSAKVFSQNHPEIRDSQFWGGHLWSHSYYMSTLGNMSREVVERYIRNQNTK